MVTLCVQRILVTIDVLLEPDLDVIRNAQGGHIAVKNSI